MSDKPMHLSRGLVFILREESGVAYSELIKNFEKIRSYMRDFYVYGFKSRDDYTQKSARSYDDERRRIESWLGDCMGFRQTSGGKNVFISIDSRLQRSNPLYRAWKSCSFTDGDITLHFFIFDILYSPEVRCSMAEIHEGIEKRQQLFLQTRVFDESTIRKKLKEYEAQGIVKKEKVGHTVLYSRCESCDFDFPDALMFFSEIAPCGVIGSFLLDKLPTMQTPFAFKHHYITHTLDSDILCSLFDAIDRRCSVTLEVLNRRKTPFTITTLPLKIFISVQNGRQYLMSYSEYNGRIFSTRLDNILSVKTGDVCENFEEHRQKLEDMQQNLWGVSTGRGGKVHIEFTVRCVKGEEYIFDRMMREKRCGNVVRLDENTCRFSADVYDAGELVPWIRTFICRITQLKCTNEEIVQRFKEDLQQMYRLYGIKEEALV